MTAGRSYSLPPRSVPAVLGRPTGSRTHSTGQAIAEFALILPVLMLMLLGAAEMGMLYAQRAAQDRATGVVADYAADHPGDDSWNAVAAHELAGCTVTVTTDSLGIVTASSTCIYTPKVTAGLWQGLPIGSTADAETQTAEPSTSPEPSASVAP